MTSLSREMIQASAPVRSVGTGPSVVAPFIRANLVAFQSLVEKLREDSTISWPIGTSVPGLAPRGKGNRAGAGAVGVHPLQRIDAVAARLRHLLTELVADHAVQGN